MKIGLTKLKSSIDFWALTTKAWLAALLGLDQNQNGVEATMFIV